LRAQAILDSDEFASDVREAEQLWTSRGITSVPTMVFNDQYAVSGGQPVEVFVSAIRQMLSESK
ncbi:DsbA family oxidoreductase, partial [Pseudomonas syringae]